MTNHYDTRIYRAGNAHCIRNTRSMAVVEVLRNAEFFWYLL